MDRLLTAATYPSNCNWVRLSATSKDYKVLGEPALNHMESYAIPARLDKGPKAAWGHKPARADVSKMKQCYRATW